MPKSPLLDFNNGEWEGCKCQIEWIDNIPIDFDNDDEDDDDDEREDLDMEAPLEECEEPMPPGHQEIIADDGTRQIVPITAVANDGDDLDHEYLDRRMPAVQQSLATDDRWYEAMDRRTKRFVKNMIVGNASVRIKDQDVYITPDEGRIDKRTRFAYIKCANGDYIGKRKVGKTEQLQDCDCEVCGKRKEWHKTIEAPMLAHKPPNCDKKLFLTDWADFVDPLVQVICGPVGEKKKTDGI